MLDRELLYGPSLISPCDCETVSDWYPLNIRHRSEEICKGINSRYKINKKTGVIQSNRYPKPTNPTKDGVVGLYYDTNKSKFFPSILVYALTFMPEDVIPDEFKKEIQPKLANTMTSVRSQHNAVLKDKDKPISVDNIQFISKSDQTKETFANRDNAKQAKSLSYKVKVVKVVKKGDPSKLNKVFDGMMKAVKELKMQHGKIKQSIQEGIVVGNYKFAEVNDVIEGEKFKRHPIAQQYAASEYGNIALDYNEHPNKTISYGRITKGTDGNPPWRGFSYTVDDVQVHTLAHVFIHECMEQKVMAKNQVVRHDDGPGKESRKDEDGYHRNWAKDLKSGDNVDNSRDYHENRTDQLRVKMFDKNGILLGEHKSVPDLKRDWENSNKETLVESCIWRVLNGERKHHHGYTFKYADEQQTKRQRIK